MTIAADAMRNKAENLHSRSNIHTGQHILTNGFNKKLLSMY